MGGVLSTLLYIVSAKILVGLAAHGDPLLITADENDGRAGDAVVIGRHGVIISSRHKYGEGLAALGAWDLYPLGDKVAALAAAPQGIAGDEIC